jgi:hypothetical protein
MGDVPFSTHKIKASLLQMVLPSIAGWEPGAERGATQAKWHAEYQLETVAMSLTYCEAVGLETQERRRVAQEHPARPGCLRQQAILGVLVAPIGCNQNNIPLSFVFK